MQHGLSLIHVFDDLNGILDDLGRCVEEEVQSGRNTALDPATVLENRAIATARARIRQQRSVELRAQYHALRERFESLRAEFERSKSAYVAPGRGDDATVHAPPSRATTRERIIVAALDCFETNGVEGTSLSAVARRARLSRPTLYKVFPSRDVLIAQAMRHLVTRTVANAAHQARDRESFGDFVVDVVTAVRRDVMENRAFDVLVSPTPTTFGHVRRSVSPEVVASTDQFVEGLLRRAPHLAEVIDEVVETIARFLVSVLWIPSHRIRTDEQLRQYLRRRLVPALGLSVTERNVALTVRARL